MSLLLSVSDGQGRLLSVTKDGKVLQYFKGSRSTLPVNMAQGAAAANASLVSASIVVGDELVLGSVQGLVVVYELRSGSQSSLQLPAKARVNALALDERRLLAATSDGQLYEFARLGGSSGWATAARLVKDELGSVSAVASLGEWLYVAAKDGTRLHCLDAATAGSPQFFFPHDIALI